MATRPAADWKDRSNRRRYVAMLQLLCMERDIAVGKIDGLWGPQTEFAFDMLAHHREHREFPPPFRDETPLDVNPNAWPHQSQADLIQYFSKRTNRKFSYTT